jgi:hypothetical protein
VRELAPALVRLSKREQAPALQSVEVRTIWRARGKILTLFFCALLPPLSLFLGELGVLAVQFFD